MPNPVPVKEITISIINQGRISKSFIIELPKMIIKKGKIIEIKININDIIASLEYLFLTSFIPIYKN